MMQVKVGLVLHTCELTSELELANFHKEMIKRFQRPCHDTCYKSFHIVLHMSVLNYSTHIEHLHLKRVFLNKNCQLCLLSTTVSERTFSYKLLLKTTKSTSVAIVFEFFVFNNNFKTEEVY